MKAPALITLTVILAMAGCTDVTVNTGGTDTKVCTGNDTLNCSDDNSNNDDNSNPGDDNNANNTTTN
jgi:hypothetical protein